MADSKLTALSEISVPNLEDLAYIVDDPAGTPVSNKVSVARLLGNMLPSICEGRLTTESGVPVSASDRSAQGTIYFTPYNGNRISLYDGTRWKLYSFSELSLSLTMTVDKNYDVYVYDNSGTLTLELSAAWTNDTTRADALGTQDGIYIKSGTSTRRCVGTIRASASNQTEDSVTKRFVWNMYNRVQRNMIKLDSTTSWTYGTNSWRAARGDSTNRLQMVVGLAESMIETLVIVSGYGSASDGRIGIDEDGSSTPETTCQVSYVPNTSGSFSLPLLAKLTKIIPLGFHYYQWVEIKDAGGNITFEGANQRAGISGSLSC